MGTINHKTSDYITLARKEYDIDDFKDMDEPMTAEDILSIIHNYYEDDWANVEYLLNQHSFCYFHVELESGYYESFSIQIENNFSVCYDNYKEKQEAIKEAKELKSFLLEAADMGMKACHPGWCTGWEDRNGTIKAINKAAAEMRRHVLSIPCYRTLKRAGELS